MAISKGQKYFDEFSVLMSKIAKNPPILPSDMNKVYLDQVAFFDKLYEESWMQGYSDAESVERAIKND